MMVDNISDHIIDDFINRVIPSSQLLKARYVLIFCDPNCSGSATSDEMALVATYVSGRDTVVRTFFLIIWWWQWISTKHDVM